MPAVLGAMGLVAAGSAMLHDVNVPSHDVIVNNLELRWPEHRVAPSLGRIAALMDLLGRPDQSAPVVQITGTNGKGSTAIILDALLRAAGLRVGRFASPHLQDLTERICIDGAPLSADRFDDLYAEVAPLVSLVDQQRIDGVQCTFFEVMTAMAYAAFADAPVDVAVMEVGMGGSWDATSVADAAVAVVTPVDLDHMQYLGDTVTQIAAEKAGIIKAGSVAVLAAQSRDAEAVLAQRCLDVGASMVGEPADFALIERQLAAGGQVIRIMAGDGPVGDLFLPLHGEHMAHNAALAVAACEALLGRPLNPDVIQQGFDEVVAPGRLQLVMTDPPVVVDTAHNPHGVRATLDGVAEAFAFDPLICVLAMMRDKAVPEVLDLLAPAVATLVVTQVSSTDRAMPAEDLAEVAREVLGGDQVVVAPEVADAVGQARRLAASSGGGVLVIGSVYLAGEVLDLVDDQKREAAEWDDSWDDDEDDQ